MVPVVPVTMMMPINIVDKELSIKLIVLEAEHGILATATCDKLRLVRTYPRSCYPCIPPG